MVLFSIIPTILPTNVARYSICMPRLAFMYSKTSNACDLEPRDRRLSSWTFDPFSPRPIDCAGQNNEHEDPDGLFRHRAGKFMEATGSRSLHRPVEDLTYRKEGDKAPETIRKEPSGRSIPPRSIFTLE